MSAPSGVGAGRSGRRCQRRVGRRWLVVLAMVVSVTTAVGVAPAPAGADPVELTEWYVGGTPVPIAPGDVVTGLDYYRTDLATYEGRLVVYPLYFPWVEITRDVDGVGPVTMKLRPDQPAVGFPTVMSGFLAQVAADGSVTTTSPRLRMEIRELSYGDFTAVLGDCAYYYSDVVGHGQVHPDGISVRTESVGEAVAGCGDHGPVVEAALVGPAWVDMWFPGSHPITAQDVPSQMVVTPSAPGGTVHEPIDVDVAVTYTAAGVEHGAEGAVRAYEDGVQVAAATLRPDGTATLTVDLSAPGTREYELVYGGRVVDGVSVPLPSSATFTLESQPFPDGRQVSGAITVGELVSSIGSGAVWVGGDYDPETGSVGPGHLLSPVGPVALPLEIFGNPLVAQMRLVQVGEVSGQVHPDGTVDLDPVQFQADVRSATYVGDLGDCVGEPFEVQFEGTADADGLHLYAEDVTVGEAPPGSCDQHANNINNSLNRSPTAIELHVAGDFTPPVAVTETAVQSWYGEVAQFNQTILTAQVSEDGAGPVSSGTVEFRDGDQVLATVPVRNGVANAVVFMASPGERTITASYSGVGGPPSSATTTLVVTPAPVGSALAGGLSINGWEVAPGASGVVSGSAGPGGTASWLPVTLEGDVGGGPSAAEVRLLPLGELTASGSGVQGTYWLHLRSVTKDGSTTTPLGCITSVTVDFQGDGAGGGAVASGSAVPLDTGWGCRAPLAAAWTDALAGEVTGTLALAG